MQTESDEWLEWAAYNLALGLPEREIKAEMSANGIAAEAIEGFISSLQARPEYRAARQISRKLKLTCDLNEALLEMASQVFDFAQIGRVSGLSSQDFLERYYSANRPVIIEGVVSDWPAVAKWSLDFFRQNFGSEPVRFQYGRSASDHRDCFVDHTVEAPFKEFLDLIERPARDSSPPYLIAHDRMLDKPGFKPLLDDVVFDQRYFDANDTHGRVFFWLGPADSTTPMHRDLGNVYMAQVMGRKLIRMVPSTQLHLMYNEHGYHSEADFDRLSLDHFPLLKKASIMEFVLEPGDLLFIPVGWWHFVKSLETTVTVTGNNFRFSNQLRPIFD